MQSVPFGVLGDREDADVAEPEQIDVGKPVGGVMLNGGFGNEIVGCGEVTFRSWAEASSRTAR